MSTEQQIEEMAKDLQKSEHWYFNDHSVDFELDRKKTAENLYNAGYRKQQSEGEWRNLAKVGVYMCTACTQLSPRPYPYCPKCGAKMKGGGE